MTSDSERMRTAGGEAAEWYVEIDANPADPERAAALGEWLERSSNHEAAFERCEAAVMLARELAARGELDPVLPVRGEPDGVLPVCAEPDDGLHVRAQPGAGLRGRDPRDAARDLARRRAGATVSPFAWLRRPAVAWSVAAIAVLWAVAASFEREGRVASDANALRAATPTAPVVGGRVEPSGGFVEDRAAPPAGLVDGDRAGPGASSGPEPSVAAAGVTAAAFVTWDPVALLPNQIVVDVHSVAVLPFDGGSSGEPVHDSESSTAAERIARQLHEEVMRQLGSIPGVYVVDGRSSGVRAGGELGPDEIAALLSVRGVVAADVELDEGSVRVNLRMTDAANDGRLIETMFERPLEELPAVRTAIVSNIADTLASTAF